MCTQADTLTYMHVLVQIDVSGEGAIWMMLSPGLCQDCRVCVCS